MTMRGEPVDNFLQRNSALTIAELQAQTTVDIEAGRGKRCSA
jgi:hypothetical protein